MRKVLATGALLCLVLAATVTNGFAQTANGQLGGVVQDPSNALIPGVTVTLTNTETGVSAIQVTNESGVYSFPSIQPGNAYTVTAALPGFKTSVTKDVTSGDNRTSPAGPDSRSRDSGFPC